MATKQRQIGAAKTVAVSSNGFSVPAVRAAKLHGISTRIIAKLSDDEIREWIGQLQIEIVDTNYTLGSLRLEYEDDRPGTYVDPQLEQDWLQRGLDAAIFLDTANQTPVSLADLIERAVRPSKKHSANRPNAVRFTLPPESSIVLSDDPLAVLAKDAPSDGSSLSKTFWIEATQGEISMRTTIGTVVLRRVGFDITMSATRRRVPVSRAVSYADEQKGIVDVAEHQFTLKSGAPLILTSYPAGTGAAPPGVDRDGQVKPD